MSETIIIAIISLLGTLFGTFGGIVTSGKLTNYRINMLEEQVKKHNDVIERVYKLEEHGAVIDEQIKVANKRILDLEHHEETRKGSK